MRILLCKIICFCKSSSQLYKPAPLRIDNTTQEHKQQQRQKHKSSVCKGGADETAGNKDNRSRKQSLVVHKIDDDFVGFRLQSSLKKSSPEKYQKKKVQWLDFLGKELVQIREFESGEAYDTKNEGAKSRGCVCNIL